MHAIFGLRVRDHADVPESAVQVSPNIPGAKRLEDFPPSSLDSISILVPPGTIERRYVLATALRVIKSGARFLAFGPKDKGGSRIQKELEEFGCVVESDSRKHDKICTTTKPETENASLTAAITEGAPRFDETIQLYTQPGVFSWNRVDIGSELLASCLPTFSGTGADLGAGLGYLSKIILEKSPRVQKLLMIELDRRAVECAKKNVTSPKAEILWQSVRDPLAYSQLDFVVTNPPFHDGGIEDQDLGRIFIQQAAHILKMNGQCWLVANKHLPYEEVLKSVFTTVNLKAERDGFKIFEAIR